MENIIEIFKTPTYNLINNYKDNVELYTRKSRDIEELFDKTNDDTKNPVITEKPVITKITEKEEKELKDGIKKVGMLIVGGILMFIIVQFIMLFFIMNKKKKLSSLVYLSCILAWWFSWFFPILIIPLIIVVLIAQK